MGFFARLFSIEKPKEFKQEVYTNGSYIPPAAALPPPPPPKPVYKDVPKRTERVRPLPDRRTRASQPSLNPAGVHSVHVIHHHDAPVVINDNGVNDILVTAAIRGMMNSNNAAAAEAQAEASHGHSHATDGGCDAGVSAGHSDAGSAASCASSSSASCGSSGGSSCGSSCGGGGGGD